MPYSRKYVSGFGYGESEVYLVVAVDCAVVGISVAHHGDELVAEAVFHRLVLRDNGIESFGVAQQLGVGKLERGEIAG